MNITLNIPDASAADLVNGIAAATGWTAASGVTKADWAKARMAQWIKDTAKRGLLKTRLTELTASIDPVNIA
jgi:hypothetical protein